MANSLPETLPEDSILDVEGIVQPTPGEEEYEEPPQPLKIPTSVDEVLAFTEAKWSKIRWDLLPKHVSDGIDKERVEKILSGAAAVYDLEVPENVVSGMETAIKNRSSDAAQVMSLLSMYRTYDIDRPIDYRSGAPAHLRYKLAGADTPKEQRKILEDEFGADNVSKDKHGRILFRNPETGLETSIDDEGQLSFGDMLAVAQEAPVVFATLGAAYATGGMSLKYQFGADLLGIIAGFGLREGIDHVSGDNLENMNEIYDRLKYEAAMGSAFFGVGAGVAKTAGLFKNPLSGGVTPKSIEMLSELENINRQRLLRGKGELSPRVSIVNAAPIISRMEGMLSKIPGGAGVFQKNKALLDRQIDEEVEYLLEGFQGYSTETRNTVAKKIRNNIINLIEERQNAARAAYNARYTGVDHVTGSKVLTDGTEAALTNFRMRSDARMNLVHSYAGKDPFISPSDFKKVAGRFIGDLTKTKGGKAIEFLNVGASRKDITSLLGVKDSLNFKEAHRIRAALDEMLQGGREMPIEGTTRTQVKELRDALTSDIKRDSLALSRLNPDSPRVFNRERFLKEYTEFSEFYDKGHRIFNEKGGTAFEIIQKSRNSPYDLVDNFLRTGNAHHWKTIKETLSPEEFSQVQGAAKDYLLSNNRTGSDLLKKMHALGDDTMNTILGGNREVSLWRRFANWQQRAEASVLRKFQDESASANRVFSSYFADGANPEKAVEVRRLLGKGSQDWKRIQLAHASRLIENARDADGILDGTKLVGALSGESGAVNRAIFGDGILGKNLKNLADISSAARKAEGGAAGGLAAGLYVVGLMTGHVVAAGTAGAASWMSAKALTSKTARRWLTNKPLNRVTGTWIRAATEEMQRLATGMDNSEFLFGEEE